MMILAGVVVIIFQLGEISKQIDEVKNKSNTAVMQGYSYRTYGGMVNECNSEM